MAILSGMNGSSSGGSSSLGYENPAFKIKIVSPNDSMQQQRSGARRNSSLNAGNDLKEGDSVTALVGKREISGRIRGIKKNTEGEIIFVELEDQDGKVHEVDVSRIKTGNPEGSVSDAKAKATSTQGVFGESHQVLPNVKLFEEFINS